MKYYTIRHAVCPEAASGIAPLVFVPAISQIPILVHLCEINSQTNIFALSFLENQLQTSILENTRAKSEQQFRSHHKCHCIRAMSSTSQLLPVDRNQPKSYLPWVLVAAGYASITFLVTYSVENTLARIGLFFLAFFAIQFTLVFLHELGHLLAFVLSGSLPATLEIGSGPKIAGFNLGPVTFRFRSSTNCGCVLPGGGLVTITHFTAGPITDAIVLILFIKLWIFPPDSLAEHPLFEAQFQPLLIITVAHTFFFQLYYLFRPASYREGQFSDARGMAQAWNFESAPDDVRQAYERLHKTLLHSEKYPESSSPQDADDLQTYTQWMTSFRKADDELTRDLKDMYVTATLLYGWEPQLTLADRYSQELLSAHPAVMTYKGSRGAVLVDLGQLEAGKTLLKGVFTHSNETIDRVISAAFIAIADHRLGNHDDAERWLAQASEIDPTSLAYKRAQALIASYNPLQSSVISSRP